MIPNLASNIAHLGPRALLCGTLVALSSLALVPAAQAACPNEAIRADQGTTYLPGCMALEQATPPQKGGSPTAYPSFSANGERLLFKSPARLGDSTSYVNPLGDYYIAERAAEGWSTSATTAPGSFGFGPAGNDQAQAFAPGFGSWVSFELTQEQRAQGDATLWEGAPGGPWVPRSPLLELIRPGGIHGSDEFNTVPAKSVAGTSPDLSHVIFVAGSEARYLAGDPPVPKLESALTPTSTYLIADGPGGEPTLELLARDASGAVWGGNCGAWLGGGGTSQIPGGRNQGAISADGSRILFSTRPGQLWDSGTATGPSCEVERPVRILVREQSPAGPQIEELLPAAPAAGSDFFEGASEDQSRIYLTSSRALVGTDLDTGSPECSRTLGASNGCDLYLYETTPSGHRIVQVSAGATGDPTPGEGADVIKGVTAISGDGSHVYYVAQDVLTTDPNPEGAEAEAGKPNLYAYDAETESTAFIGVLTSAASGKLFGTMTNYPGYAEAVPMTGESGDRQVGGDGHVLLFQTSASLSAEDTDGGRLDVYRYDAVTPPTLRCVSCRPGGPDAEPFDVGGRAPLRGGVLNTEFAEYERWGDEAGQGVVFATKEALLPEDTDGELSDYLWRDGSLALLPGNGKQPTISHSGEEVAFETPRVLLPTDTDTAPDIYIAREGGGFPTPPQTTPCSGEACQGQVASPPAVPTAATAGFEGAGNPKPGPGCPKGELRRHGRCMKTSHRKKHRKHHTRHGHKHRHGSRRAGHYRGGK